MISRALDLTIGLMGSIVTAPLVAALALAVRLESRGDPIYRQKRIGKDGRPFQIYKLRTMITGAEFTGAGLAVAAGDSRITRVGELLRRYSLDELPNLWNVLRGEMAIVGPRPTLEGQVRQYSPRQRGRLAVRPGITGWAQIHGRASSAVGPADRARPMVRRAPLAQARSADPCANSRDGRQRPRHLQGRQRRMAGPERDDLAAPGHGRGGGERPAVLLTGVGKRYDIVSAFAQHTTVIAADPNPLAPAQYAAHHRRSVPPIHDPDYVSALEALCTEFGVGAVVPLTDLDLEVLGHARVAGRLPAFVPDPEFARATFDKYEAHLLLTSLGLPSPATVLPGEAVDSYPVMVKPRQGSGARSIHRADDQRAAEFFVDYVKEPTMIQRAMDGPEFSIDCLSDLDGRCLNAIPRTMIESRGGESIKGTVIDDRELIEPRPPRRRGARLPRSLHRAGVP